MNIEIIKFSIAIVIIKYWMTGGRIKKIHANAKQQKTIEYNISTEKRMIL